MPVEYYLTTTVKDSGKGRGTCLYLPSQWGLTAGTKVLLSIWDAERTPDDIAVFTVFIRAANTRGGLRVTVPKSLHASSGEWVTFKLIPAVI